MRYRLICLVAGLLMKAYMLVTGLIDQWRRPPWTTKIPRITQIDVGGEHFVFLPQGHEWYCTASGWSKAEIVNRGHCCHGGPCPMDVRRAGA